MDSRIKSYKSHGSYKAKKSIGSEEELQEELPILSQHKEGSMKPDDGNEVVVKVDAGSRNDEPINEPGSNGLKVWGEPNYNYWNENQEEGKRVNPSMSGFSFQQQAPENDDPPSKLIGQFLDKQKAIGEIALDMDLNMDEMQLTPNQGRHHLTPSKDLRVSFQDSSGYTSGKPPNPRKTYKNSSEDEDDDDPGRRRKGVTSNFDQVLKCTSNSLRTTSTMLRSRTKSRLMDPAPFGDEKFSGTMRSGQFKSGLLSRYDEDEDDPFLDEDLPDFKKDRMSTFTIVQLVGLIIILGIFVCSLTFPVLIKKEVWNLHLWKWEVMILVLISGHLVSGWGIRIIVFFIERNFLLKKRLLYFVYGVRRAVQNFLWLSMVLISWLLIFDKKVKKEPESRSLRYVTRILFCLLVATFIWLVKTLLVKILASSFHVSTYFDRIQEALFNQYVIQTLSGPPLIEIQQTKEEEDRVMAEVQNLQNAGASFPADLRATALPSKSTRISPSGGILRNPATAKSFRYSEPIDGLPMEKIQKLNQKNISAWNMKRLVNIVRNSALSTLDEQIQESSMQIRSEVEAKAAAKKIFTNVAKSGSRHIYLVDLIRFMTEDEAQKAMASIEGENDTKKINRRTLKNWVVNAFIERRALSLTLNDTKTAVNKLHQMANVVVAIIVLVIWLLILEIASTHIFVFISSQLLLVVFIFGNTCKTVFEAIIFLFVMHPYDVGDRCEIEEVQMIVEEMNILTTIFLRYDNQKITYPNSLLSTLPISNFYRSPDMGDAIDFSIHVSTPVEKVSLIKERIKGFIESKKDHWYPGPAVVVRDIEDMNRLKMSVWLQHRMNHQNMGERWNRRELVVEEMIKIFRELEVEYRMLPLDVNLRNMPAMTSTRLPSTWKCLT